jgi:hypothetical protein
LFWLEEAFCIKAGFVAVTAGVSGTTFLSTAAVLEPPLGYNSTFKKNHTRSIPYQIFT